MIKFRFQEMVANNWLLKTALLIFTCSLGVQLLAQQSDPLLKFESGDLLLLEAMEEVTNQTGLEFSYVEALFPKDGKINLPAKVYTLSEFMDLAFKPFQVSWTRRNNLIILTKNPAQIKKKITISGFLKDKDSGEGLIGAHVIDINDSTGVLTNGYGFYSLTTYGYPQRIVYSYLGYEAFAAELHAKKDSTVNVFLSTNSDMLEEVTIQGGLPIHMKTQMSSATLRQEDIKSIPAFLGEVDILKAMQLLPGVQSGVEGSSGIYVRGGGPDQNLILLDGVPVYNANHLFGFFSVFNADAIHRVDLIKGGFPARYGGRLSSVIDIKMKEGNMNEFHGEGAIGNIASKITLEGPIKVGKTSFMVSGRRTYLDALILPLARLAGNDRIVSYHFLDFNGKVNHIFSDKDRVFISAYAGQDKFRDDYEAVNDLGVRKEYLSENADLGWGNITTALRWNHVFGPHLFGNMTATFSRYEFNLSDRVDYTFDTNGAIENVFRHNNYTSNIRDLALKLDFDYLPSNRHHLRFGAAVIHHLFEPGISRFQSHLETDTTFGSSEISTREYYAYLEDEIKLSARASLNAGIHLSGSSTGNTFYTSLQPRMSFNYSFRDLFSLKASYAKMAQYIHLLVNSGVGLPTDLWVPVTDRVKPQMSDQIALGLATEVANALEVTIEGYYKWMFDLIEYKDGASFLDIDDAWEDKIETGDGYSYGLELLVRKSIGKTTGWLGYTWSKTMRQFEKLNFGREFPYRYDRRHDISFTVNHLLKPHIELGLVWVYGTGFPVTLPTSTYQRSYGHITGRDPAQEFIKSYPGRNSSRTRNYHRLDLSISFLKIKRWGERKWILGLYNAYSRLNPTFISFDDELSQDKKFVQLSLFPVIPAVSYQFKF